MKIIDTENELDVVGLVTPDAVTSTVTGTGVDISEYQGKLKVCQHVKQGGGTDPTLDGKIQDSADDSTYADVTGATFTQVTDAADSLQSLGLDTRNCKKYIRYVGPITGTNPTFDLGVSFIGQKQTL